MSLFLSSHTLARPSQEAQGSASLPATPKWSFPDAMLQQRVAFPQVFRLCHLRSQLFSDLELPARSPAK